MGWFKAVKDLFTAAPKVVETIDKVADKGMSMLDNAFFTDQEKSDSAAKLYIGWLDMTKNLVNDTGISSMTRRILAVMFSFVFILLVVFSIGIYWYDPEWSAYVIKMIEDSNYGWIMLAIVSFHFGFYGWGRHIGGKK